MKYRLSFLVLVLIILQSCSNTSAEKVTNKTDYDKYLGLPANENFETAEQSNEFWLEKLNQNPNGHAYMVKAASTYGKMFSTSGDIEFLKLSEDKLIKANERTKFNNPGYLKSLAHNYISQHRFREALELLEKAENFQEGIEGTKKMLFDVHLELGNYVSAKTYLDKFESFSDFDYLIRLSKWNDHKGDLDAAIKYMEKAVTRAESRNLKGLMQWSYTNIADFYGHAGEINKSYQNYLKALELDPYDAYSKKGIAWILYSHEKNPNEALRVLNTVTENYHAPDYHLLKAEIAEYQGNKSLVKEQMALYHQAMTNEAYGDMYNKYNVLVYVDDTRLKQDAINIAQTEVKNRPTPQSYDLLAWAYFKNGNLEKALGISEKYVFDKTFEPEALYHTAEIFKANGKTEVIQNIKKELIASVYELGPTMASKIQKL